MTAGRVGLLKHGDLGAQQVSRRIYGHVDTEASIDGIGEHDRVDGMSLICMSPVGVWVFDEDAVGLTEAGKVRAPTVGTGNWINTSGGSGATTTDIVRARAMSTANIASLAAASTTQDTVTMVEDDLLFVPNQTDHAQDGLYLYGVVGGGAAALTRSAHVLRANMIVQVSEGSANNVDSFWQLTNNGTITPGTTVQTWVRIPSALTSTAPADVTKAAAAVGTSVFSARSDHKHDISTAAPSNLGTANAEGTAASLSRSDHVHAHGDQTVGTLHAAVVSGGTSGFMTGADKAALDALLVSGLSVASKTVGFADLVALGAVQQGSIDFDAALPAGAMVVGYGKNVTASFDNAGDTASGTSDLGIKDGDTDVWIDGGSLNAVAKVSTPSGTGASLVGAVIPSIVFDFDVNFDTLTKGIATYYVVYALPF